MQRLKMFFGRFKKMNHAQIGSTGKMVAALAVVTAVLVSSMATVMGATHTAHILYNGQKKDVEITENETPRILLKAGINLSAGDIVKRREDPGHTGDVLLTVRTTVPVRISADGVHTSALAHYGDTVKEVLTASGISTEPEDTLTPAANTTVTANDEITIKRCRHITVTADGQTKDLTVQQGTVSRALSQAGLTLGQSDILNADAQAQVTDGMRLKVSRVSYQNVTKTESIPFNTVTRKDNSLYAGTKKVAAEGRSGSKSTVYRRKLVDGKVAQDQAVQSTVVQQPADRVVLVGTKSRSSGAASVCADGTLMDTGGNTVSYRKVFTGRCSGYTGGGWTSTGRKAAFGLVAVNPNLIPYGSRLYICSPDGKTVYGYAVAADTGGAAMSGAIIADLYYDTYNQCMNFGSRTMNVYVLK